ncbi:sensor histidine kinase [Paenibacillus radicis (ex Gao et al. 2016)]|uniref:histidine kinase n=1 Tax=Paenibacillus radicis (ex Gao et al. 2016) TaxID=1737354 RepID=A0A917GR06_9BACL|nr:sensor histidine kinase [Paenibacillus radicis (ex Gao et al. 2016)]GGG53915.1 sensor histidine kinase [Paenibacillus radicis (ex Gao et al. 2016)]
MKLFFREHALLLVVQLVQLGFIVSIYWLDGYRDLLTVLYSVFIAFFILSGYLVYQFVSRKHYYLRLSQPLESFDASIQQREHAPVSEALQKLLHSQYRHYEQQLYTLKKQQEEHLIFMDQWVHQMKTPLSVIDLTVQHMDEPEFASIREELERMRSGLHTVLYMSRLRAFEQDFHVKPVALSQMISNVIHDNKRLFIRNRIYPEVQSYTSDITVETDEKWLFFMLSQLVINAVKYSAGTDAEGKKVVVSYYLRGNEPVIEVADRGIGIPAADMKRVFDSFFTGQNGRGTRESTGMGLYLTKEAADRLGHRIELTSEEGNGTQVRIVFASYQKLTTV